VLSPATTPTTDPQTPSPKDKASAQSANFSVSEATSAIAPPVSRP